MCVLYVVCYVYCVLCVRVERVGGQHVVRAISPNTFYILCLSCIICILKSCIVGGQFCVSAIAPCASYCATIQQHQVGEAISDVARESRDRNRIHQVAIHPDSNHFW